MNAVIQLEREGEPSSIMARTYEETLYDIDHIEWAPSHVVFYKENGGLVAIKASRVVSVIVE